MFNKKLLITACDKDCKHFIDVVRGIEHVGAGWTEHAEVMFRRPREIHEMSQSWRVYTSQSLLYKLTPAS